jgi:hypothetical protein
VNDLDKIAGRKASIRKRIARFVGPRPLRRKTTADRATRHRPPEPDQFRRLPDRIPLHDMRTAQAIRPTHTRTNERDIVTRYACDDLGNN